MVLKESEEAAGRDAVKNIAENVLGAATLADQSNSQSRILSYLLSELERTLHRWEVSVEGKPGTLNADMALMTLSLYVTAENLGSSDSLATAARRNNLRKESSKLGSALAKLISRSSTEQYVVDELLMSIAPFLPDSIDEVSLGGSGRLDTMLYCISKQFAPAVTERQATLREKASALDFEVDPMELDHESEPSQHSFSPIADLRLDFVTSSSLASARASISAYLAFLSYAALDEQAAELRIASSRYIDYLCELPTYDLLCTRPIFLISEHSELLFTAKDAERLLEHIAQTLLQNYECERCEVALNLCLDVMRLTVSLWVGKDPASLNEIGTEMYTWFVDKAFAGGISSTRVQMRLSDLLLSLLKVQSDHVLGRSKPSVRTTLFEILKHGELPVQYHTANHLPTLFGMFVLSQHEKILEDIRESLPNDADWIEGIALRLLVLSNLASAWQTLLRRSLYHIFETAGVVKDATSYASICVSRIANALGLSERQELFRLFHSQLIYTWLSEKPFELMPWATFGYVSLAELVQDVRDEFVGQSVMRGKDPTLETLGTLLGYSVPELIIKSFPQVTAYAFASDAATSGSQEAVSRVVEARVRDSIGKNSFSKILESQFPHTVGHLFRRLELEDGLAKAFSKRSNFPHASKIFQRIVGQESDEDHLPASQQPSFRSKFLIDELERLCRRVHRDSRMIWTPYLVTVTARMLIDDIVPVLGSLHARRQIQRLRILVCVSGSTAVCGYPLELLLHALRPFLTDSHCAQDAIGIFQYLMEAGRDFLLQRQSFLCVTSVATFLSIRKFLKTTQDSTTQESHHRARLSRAQNFREWLGDFLDSNSLDESFRKLWETSRFVSGSGTARSHTPASELLITFLNDMKSPRSLLPPPLFETCYSLLCEDFDVPENFDDDVLGTNDSAVQYAAQLWQSCSIPRISPSYLAWTAKTLGRSFATTGQVPLTISKETDFGIMLERSRMKKPIPEDKEGHKMLAPSKIALVKSLAGMLQSESARDASLAEQTFRQLLTRSQDSEDGSLIKGVVTEEVYEALRPDPSVESSEELPLSIGTQKLELAECFHQRTKNPAPDWMQNLAASLIDQPNSDPMLRPFRRAVYSMQPLSEQLFPFLLHITLEADKKFGGSAREIISKGFQSCFSSWGNPNPPLARHCLHAFLYLRSQAIPTESTRFDRNFWLDVNFNKAAAAAFRCNMYKTALLLIEIGQSVATLPSRRQSFAAPEVPNDLLLAIFKEVEDPDSYHGVPRPSTIQSVADDHAFEGSGTQELLMRGAESDSIFRSGHVIQGGVLSGVINSMTRLNLSSLTQGLFSSQSASLVNDSVIESMTQSALRLSHWDFNVPTAFESDTSTVFRTFQSIQKASNVTAVRNALDGGAVDIFLRTRQAMRSGRSLHSALAALASITEADEIFNSRNIVDLRKTAERFRSRYQWMGTSR